MSEVDITQFEAAVQPDTIMTAPASEAQIESFKAGLQKIGLKL